MLAELTSSLDESQQRQLRLLMRVFETNVNKIRQVHEDGQFLVDNGELSADDLVLAVQGLLDSGVPPRHIRNSILPNLGYDIASIPERVLELVGRID